MSYGECIVEVFIESLGIVCLDFMAYQHLKVIQCQIHCIQIVQFQGIQFSIITQFSSI